MYAYKYILLRFIALWIVTKKYKEKNIYELFVRKNIKRI